MGYFHSSTAARSTRRFPWHVLSKQRSCAPFNGILINTDVGNPIAPFTMALERQASFMRQVGTHNGISLYKGIRSSFLTYAFFLLCLSISCALKLQHPSSPFRPQPTPTMSGAGGKWMASSVTEGQIKMLRKAGYLSKDIPHRLPEAGQLLPTPRPN